MAVNVARIYEQTIRPGRAYCRVCLRSAAETTLVPPKNIGQFTEALKLNIFEGKKVRSVCYVCEAYAGTALLVYQACVNAVSVKNVCQPLKNMKANDPVPESLRKAIFGCNASLKEYRKKSVMQQTEVLVVDSSGIEWQPGKGSVNEPTKIIAPPMSRQLPAQALEQPLVTVVLDDDDDDMPPNEQTPTIIPPTNTTVPTLVPIQTLLHPKHKNTPNLATLLPKKMQILCRHENDEKSFVLHPVVVGESGNLVAPSLGAQVVNGQLVYDAKVYKPMPMVDCTQTSYVLEGSNLKPVQDTTNSQIEPEEILPDKRKPTTNSKPERIYGTDQYKKRLSDAPDRANKKKTVDSAVNSQYVVDLDTINNILNNTEDPLYTITNDETPIAVISNVISKSEDPIAIISNVVSTSDELRGEEAALSKVTSRAPQLVEKNDKIDWEDKIPMDVISFVDSTNPSDCDLIVADPHSQQTHAGTQTPAATNLRSTDKYVIDLC
ncbi:hypothetical protein O0L34_g10525 [Tuta absoluta]|nr:hypothetical protein O0L34_g10525 [Tuta absoluta]